MHPCFLDQVERLAAAVEVEQRSKGVAARQTANAKVLRRIVEIAFDEVPIDPGHRDYRQGDTLGSSRKHWFRAKFGGGRFRLFFRYSTRAKLVVYAWVNDEDTLRTYGSRTDAYREFGRRIDAGQPPDGWDDLVVEAGTAGARSRMAKLAERLGRGK